MLKKLSIGGGVLTSKRIHGTLGDFSITAISNELLNCAKDYEHTHKVHFHYFCLLSGQDYLLRDVDTITRFLESSYPKAYIDCTPCSKGNWVYNGSRNCIWYIKSIRAINLLMPKKSVLRKMAKSPFYLVNKLIRDIVKTPKDLLKTNGINLHGGSAWWILPDHMIDYILAVNKDFDKKSNLYPLKYVSVPDENYYQTVLMNSKYANHIEVNPPEMVAQNCMTFANFSPEGKKFTGHPYVFTIEDKEKLSELSKYRLFARKFDLTIDSDVLDWIDGNLLVKA